MSRGNARILVIDHEREVVRNVRRELVANGYEVLTAFRGEKALEIVARYRPDLVLLDLDLPGMSGLEVCELMRAQSNLPPLIVFSNQRSEAEKVQALDLGADDSISKPLHMPELLARIRVALRHAVAVPVGTAARITIGPLRVDFERRRVWVREQEVRLTPTEYALLKVLITARGQLLTSQMLLAQVWGSADEKHLHALHVYIGQLRRKIEHDPKQPRLLHTLHGVGYWFADEQGYARPLIG
jgi:two-component system KDP operon response regulator KdpE